MPTPAWLIFTWDAYVTAVDDWERTIRSFRHVDTSVDPVPDADGFHHGQVLWAARPDAQAGPSLGIAWDWREVRHGIVTLTDPMAIVSNLCLHRNGEPVSEQERLVHLNNAVYRLPWQRLVCAPAPQAARRRPARTRRLAASMA